MRQLITAAFFLALLASSAARPSPGITVRPPHEIEFAAVVNAAGFEKSWTMPRYHAIVGRGGRAAADALLVAEVSDTQVLEALESLGGRPGDNLPMEAWEKRKDPRNSAADTVIAGPGVQVLLRLPGRKELLPLSSVLEDSAGRGIDMRFGGNRANIPVWKSGCIACLYSCPGSKVGNARYTERDLTRKTTSFRVRSGMLPPDRTRVGVVLRLP